MSVDSGESPFTDPEMNERQGDETHPWRFVAAYSLLAACLILVYTLFVAGCASGDAAPSTDSGDTAITRWGATMDAYVPRLQVAANTILAPTSPRAERLSSADVLDECGGLIAAAPTDPRLAYPLALLTRACRSLQAAANLVREDASPNVILTELRTSATFWTRASTAYRAARLGSAGS